MKRRLAWAGFLVLATSAGALAAACKGTGASGVSGVGAAGGSGPTTSSGAGAGGATSMVSTSNGFSSGTQNTTSTGAGQMLDVQPSGLQTISVPLGKTMPAVTYKATVNGLPASVAWTVDHGNIGTIPTMPASSATFSPTGTTGGLVTVIAGFNGMTVKRQVQVNITGSQNGADPNNPATTSQIAGSLGALKAGGGIGGVGGEGLGPATDANMSALLASPTMSGSGQQLRFLYPYDKTLWPRGLLAPLLQWDWTTGDADGIKIDLRTASGSFVWSGTFGRPAILQQTGGKFIRHPIPEDVWAAATNSAGAIVNGMSDKLTVSLTVAKGGVAYGPISETWSVAEARLAGTVYYNSYGTQLVKNSLEPSYNNGPQFGAAVLSIKGGDTGPSIVAGTPSPLNSGAGCRVCHVVSADGSKLIVQHGDSYDKTSSYDLKNGNAETYLSGHDGVFGWAALNPDASLAFTNTADIGLTTPSSQLYAFPPTGNTPLPVTGIPTDLQAGAPVFSPDGKHVSFDFIGGTIGGMTGNGTQLVSMDFDKATSTFSNLKVLATMTGGHRAGFPSFFPTNDAVAFHYQIVASNHRYNTWHGATAQIWWSDTGTGNAKELEALNGHNPGATTTYLPTGPNNHADDTVLNYEPTTNPIASGGYVWIIFTSRRLYGSVATTDPWQSDPRGYDATMLANVTTKKLWVSAVDLNAPPGSDPSHPAFYLPGQELLAGNARGFWVLDPCKADGQSCQSGDQCCNGFCEPSSMNQLVCSNMNPNSTCSAPQEKCKTAADCCDSTNLCINGFCTQQTPQ